MMRLCDIGLNQTKFIVCDGATRARYRKSWTSEPLESGKVYTIDVLLGHTHYKVQAGHRLALEIIAKPKQRSALRLRSYMLGGIYIAGHKQGFKGLHEQKDAYQQTNHEKRSTPFRA